MLLVKGANVNAKADDGTTPLALATKNGKTEVAAVAALLREKGAH
jgi:ankyrin repeat protein